jgi:hypothetical protein
MFPRSALLVVALGICGAPNTQAQGHSVPSDTLLAGITARGRSLASYDQAAWHATDAVVAGHSAALLAQVSNSMIGVQRPDGGWTIIFGRLTAAMDSFYVVFEATPTDRPDSFDVAAHSPPTPDTAYAYDAAIALRIASVDFGTPSRPYNSYVLPRSASTFWVYFVPAQTDYRSYVHGADVRYVIDARARRIVEKHPMHHALLNLALPDSAVGGVHSVIVDDVPQDTDVLLVLARRPLRPEFIGTMHYDYEVHVDGTITFRSRQSSEPR